MGSTSRSCCALRPPNQRTSLLKHPCRSTFPPLVLREVCCIFAAGTATRAGLSRQDGAQNTTQQQAQAQAQPQPQASTAQHSTVPRPVPRTPRRNVTRRNASYRTAKTAEHTHLKRVVRRVFEVDRVLLVDLTARGGGGRALSKAPRVRARERMVGTLAELWTGVGEGIGRPMRGGGKKVDQRDSAACVPVQNCAPTLLSAAVV